MKIKKTIILFFILTISSTLLWAQGGGKEFYKVTGVIRDSVNLQPVEFANIALIEPNTKKPINGAVADDKGKFIIYKVIDGFYLVEVSFIGYDTKKFTLKMNSKKSTIDLGDITISPSNKLLKEVVVQGQKNLIEETVDRTIYNAENDATIKGGDATDVLKRVPMLSVDLDGNVFLRGNQNIKVLINGKPSTITAGSVADALKQMPADQIKSVEVITSPSAKYDAEGSAGIINIITTKNILQGLTLGIDASAGFRASNLGLNGSYRTNKMGFSLGGFGRTNYNQPGSFKNIQTTAQATNTQTADTRLANIFGHYNLSWDYDINKKNYLTAAVKYMLRNNYNWQDNLLTQSTDARLNQLANVNVIDNSGTVDASLTYTRTFEKPQREFSLLALFSQNNRTNNFETQQLGSIPASSPVFQKNTNPSINEEFTLQADYQSPIGKKSIFEIGAKQIARKVNSNFISYFAFADGVYQRNTNTLLTNALFYDQNVTGAYTSLTTPLTKTYTLKVGGRYETTTINAYTKDNTPLSIPNYGVFVPSINVSKKFKNGNILKTSYNRRIQRPSIQFLNPNVQQANPLDITFGNPNLDPEYTHNYELSYSTFVKGSSINITSFARNTTGAIQSVKETNPNKPGGLQTTYQNIGTEDAYGLSIFANVNVKKFSLNGGADTYYAVLKNNVADTRYNASNTGWVYSARLFGNYSLEKGWGIQFFTFYRGRQIQLQGMQDGFGIYSLGLRKEFANKKGSIGLGAENFFTPSITIRKEQKSTVLSQDMVSVIHNLNFKITFSYRFGEMKNESPRKRKKSITNDDLKEEVGSASADGQSSGGMNTSPATGNGRQQSIPPTGKKKIATDAPVKDSVQHEVIGTWNYIIESPQKTTGTLTLKKENGKYSGDIIENQSTYQSILNEIVLKNNALNFSYEVSRSDRTITIKFKAIVTKDQLTGTVLIGEFESFPIRGIRQSN